MKNRTRFVDGIVGSGGASPGGRQVAGRVLGRALPALLLALASCTLLLNEDKEQCANQGDCAQFAGTTCSGGRCVLVGASGAGGRGGPGGAAGVAPGGASGAGGGGQCAKNSDCFPSSGPSICREQQCVALASEDCTRSLGTVLDEDKLNTIVGLITPTSGSTQTFFGDGLVKAFDLARVGYAEGAPQRTAPFAPIVVLCDEVVDPARATRHLLERLGVRLVVGPTLDQSLSAVVPEIRRIAGAVLVSPTADGVALTQAPLNLGDDSVWSCRRNRARLGPSYQAAIDGAIARFRAQRPDVFPEGGVRPYVLAPSDPSTQGFLAQVEPGLRFNEQPVADEQANGNYRRRDYPWSLTVETDIDTLVGEVVAQALGAKPPNLVIFPSSIDNVDRLINAIERAWPGGPSKPSYLIDEPIEGAADLAVDHPTVRPRILGVRPHRDARSRQAYGGFVSAYVGKYGSQPVMRSEYAFDCFFELMYGLAAAGRVEDGVIALDVNGAALRRGVGLLNAGPDLLVGKASVSTFFSRQAVSPSEISDLVGTTGPLTFDTPARTYPDADTELYCISDVNAFCFTGDVFAANTGEASTEATDCVCGQ